MSEILSIQTLLKKNLTVPNFQRPYKWQNRNVLELLEDINTTINESKKYNDFKYRIGTIILYKPESTKDEFQIIDGQQRLLTIVMVIHFLDKNFDCSLLNLNVSVKTTKENLHKNFLCIKDWFSLKSNEFKREFLNAIYSLEVVVIKVKTLSSAFQLFDSQNTRGKALDPHDLLKAYHLREMQNEPYEMYHAVDKWESFKPSEISNLFDVYLFSILNWSKKEKTETFSTQHIDYYKGIPEVSNYTYAKRAKKAEPYFQISEPFVSGKDFFDFVEHYLILRDDVNKEFMNNDSFEEIRNIINNYIKLKNGYKTTEVGFKYAWDLFNCALLCYYDKFHNFDIMAIKKMFTWAFMLRVDMQNLGFDSVNKYAIGSDDSGDKYTNHIPMFSLIKYARFHTDISNLQINVKRTTNFAQSEKWNEFYKAIKKLNGIED